MSNSINYVIFTEALRGALSSQLKQANQAKALDGVAQGLAVAIGEQIERENGLIYTEILLGEVDGSNTIFTVSQSYISDSISIYINGLQEFDFICLNDTQIKLGFAPLNIVFIDRVTATYKAKTT